MITAENLHKRYGSKTAVDGISFQLQPGKVTGFLGPNGSGKSTTMRMGVGLDKPTAGSITIDGKHFAQHKAPMRTVGAVLDAGATHPGRTGRAHLNVLAATHGISRSRIDHVIELTGLGGVVGKRIKGYSLGMNQRLGIAAALLGDPAVLIFDEPVNGLDPEGVRWVRGLAREMAAEGRTVFVSSHLMSEMSQTADHLIVLGRGRIIADAPIHELLDSGEKRVLVRTEQVAELANAITSRGVTIDHLDAETLQVTGLDPRSIGRRALEAQVIVHELTPQLSTLEDQYMKLTGDHVEYRSGGTFGEAPQ
ncbi:ABC transporter ATP-binding protein [Nesterenkonia natronophila]|uniref:ATP-binding cassette domain-containing protein n=1 Tax=Nesterenkonia natronophila TaxID=2174932 RepID=A0A3A4F9I2_9MICC|nr:ATP-binding cassette domain-containing protein [Nesterenkonia natronophila]RJN33170.1 ATP-binding cassette domain-containing protein [Nesterenkonia natronophila]